MGDSPRTTMEKVARTRAFLMLTNASGTAKAISMDRAWEKHYGEYESKRAECERRHREKIASAARDAMEAHVAHQREMSEEVEEGKQMMVLRLREDSRQKEEAQLSARSNAERQAKQFDQHVQATKRRAQTKEKRVAAATVMLKQQESNLDAATQRVRELKKEQAAHAAEKRDTFVERRTQIYAKRQEEAVKREKANAEYHKREAAIAKRGAEFEARRLAEWKERAAEGADAAMDVSRALSSSLSARHAKQLAGWNDEMAEMEARVEGLQTSRSDNAKEHARQHRERTMRHAEQKKVTCA